MPRPIRAILHLSALRNNLSIVKKQAPDSHVWAVVKANAYGHGLQRIWQCFEAAEGFALLDFNEAILLREAGWQGKILLLEGFFQPDDLQQIDRYRLTTAVHSHWQIKAIEEATLRHPLTVYLKLNSGMNRLGFAPEELFPVWQTLKELPNVGNVVIMSHFAHADDVEGVEQQLAVIRQASKHIDAGQCLANSAATLWHPQTHGVAVRPGIILYGASPSGKWCDIANYGLKAAMSLRSEIIGIQTLSVGDRVGYGGRYHADKTQRIGIVACGYADGYPRHAPTGTPVIVGGGRTQTLGTPSMDMLAVDLSACPQAGIGTDVELWGQALPVDDVALAAGTLGYELLSALAARVPVIIEK